MKDDNDSNGEDYLDIDDVVEIYIDGNLSGHGVIRNFTPADKPYWYHIDIAIIVPGAKPKFVNWTLNESHIGGEEFTMGGTPMILKLYIPSIKIDTINKTKEVNQEPPVKPKAANKVITQPKMRGFGVCTYCHKSNKFTKQKNGWKCDGCSCINKVLERKK